MKAIYLEDVGQKLDRHENAGECWLLCDLCRRFFQYKMTLSNGVGAHDACPFSDCRGAGIDCDLLLWDELREPEDPRWPRSIDDLQTMGHTHATKMC